MTLIELILEADAQEWFGEQARWARPLIPGLCNG